MGTNVNNARFHAVGVGVFQTRDTVWMLRDVGGQWSLQRFPVVAMDSANTPAVQVRLWDERQDACGFPVTLENVRWEIERHVRGERLRVWWDHDHGTDSIQSGFIETAIFPYGAQALVRTLGVDLTLERA